MRCEREEVAIQPTGIKTRACCCRWEPSSQNGVYQQQQGPRHRTVSSPAPLCDWISQQRAHAAVFIQISISIKGSDFTKMSFQIKCQSRINKWTVALGILLDSIFFKLGSSRGVNCKRASERAARKFLSVKIWRGFQADTKLSLDKLRI